MTATAFHANAELADAPCSVGECFETATTMGAATLRTDPHVSAPPDFTHVTLGLPLCTNHAHLLRGGCTLIDFRSGA
jgi:hypothetical protein